MKRYGSLVLILILLLCAGSVLVFVGKPKPVEPGGSPSTAPAPKNSDSFANEAEDRVAGIEASLLILARQIKFQASEGAVGSFTPDFTGTPLLAAPPETSASKILGSVSVTSWQGKEVGGDASALAPSLRVWFKPLAQVTYVVFKLPKCDGDGRRQEGVLVIDTDGVEPSGALVHARESYEAVFTRAPEWKISKLSRISGRRLRNARALFSDVTASLGLSQAAGVYPCDVPALLQPYSFLGGIAVGDYDDDGYLDFFVPCIGRTFMFHNEGGVFRETTRETKTLYNEAGASAIFLDYDNCGRLDLLIANFEPEIVPSLEQGRFVKNDLGRALTLLRNRGDGTFEDVTEKAGLTCFGSATSVTAADVNRDGFLDIYVCMYKDFTRDEGSGIVLLPNDVFKAANGPGNKLFINQGNGTFKEEAEKRGVVDHGWSFIGVFGDYDDDGWPDLFVVNDWGESHLYHNKGDGTFEDVTDKAGLRDVAFGMGAAWGDFTGSGRLDLYLSNMYSTAGNRVLHRGRGELTEEQHRKLLKMAHGNTLLRNRGDGTFENVTEKAGVGRAGWAWGTAWFDCELNGRPGLYVANGYVTGESDADL